jgi:SAM-dependent methyltransferase
LRERVLDRTAKGLGPLDQVPPYVLFGGVTEEAWRELHLEGREQCAFLARYLPGLSGDPDFEAKFVGKSGTEALSVGFQVYELFRQLYENYAQPLGPSLRVLDFGCGWGRVIRFFLKDIAPENLIGIDPDARAIATCIETDPWSRFELCDTLPPSHLEAESFDLIYAYSVFSHLSEATHMSWLEEFERLLRPDAVLILTTFPRTFLSGSSDGSSEVSDERPLDEWFSAYDRGEFCFRALKSVSDPAFGDAFIPERYVREHWTSRFNVHEYFAFRASQNIIVCTKR